MRTLLVGWMVLAGLVASATAEGCKLAVVVGVGTYRGNSGLPSLGKAPENDAARLGAALRSQGFTVYEMTQSAAARPGQATHAPNIAYIRDQIEGILASPNLGAEDMIVVSLHGHGVQFPLVDAKGKKTPKFYFCPADATVTGIETTEQ